MSSALKSDKPVEQKSETKYSNSMELIIEPMELIIGVQEHISAEEKCWTLGKAICLVSGESGSNAIKKVVYWTTKLC